MSRGPLSALLGALLLLAAAVGGAALMQLAWVRALAGGEPLTRFLRVISLEDHNVRVVLAGTSMLGLAAGATGSFLLLRRRALLGDALSHAMLPGVCVAFLLQRAAGGAGRNRELLLLGAAVFGLLGMLSVVLITRWTRIKQDAALAVVLSVYFGAGVALLGVIQQLGGAAGLEGYIYGRTASMLTADAWRIALVAGLVLLGCALLTKELTLLCFDEPFAASIGLPTARLDMALMGLAVAVCVVGMQAVGLILVIAMLVIPAAAARFWSDRLPVMTTLSALIGAVSAAAGTVASAVFDRAPPGAVIVLFAAAAFAASMLVGSARGVVHRWLEQRLLGRLVDHQHLLRAIWELTDEGCAQAPLTRQQLAAQGRWPGRRLASSLAAARRRGLLELDGERVRLTADGREAAQRLVRNHRLWELYLITHADIAPSHVDRDADMIEHALAPGMIAELETLLDAEALPRSPHALPTPEGSA